MRFIDSVKTQDNTRDPKKLSEKARRFHDPADKRLQMSIKFKNVPSMFINMLIRELDSDTGVKTLIPQKFKYITEFAEITTYGHDLHVEKSISQLPISQNLEEGTTFVLNVSNNSGKDSYMKSSKLGIYAMIILSDMLKPVNQIPKGLIPFNRRMHIMTLMPNETIEATFMVKKAPASYSKRRRTWWSRPTADTLTFETQLDDTPQQLMYDISTSLLETLDRSPYLAKIQVEEDTKKMLKEALEELQKAMKQAGKVVVAAPAKKAAPKKVVQTETVEDIEAMMREMGVEETSKQDQLRIRKRAERSIRKGKELQYIISNVRDAGPVIKERVRKFLLKVMSRDDILVGQLMNEIYKGTGDDLEIIKRMQAMTKGEAAKFKLSADRADTRLADMDVELGELRIESERVSFAYLDIGCYDGSNTVAVGRSLGLTPEQIHGVDVAEFAVKSSEGKPFTFALIDGKKLPYKDESMDLITMFMAAHHFIYFKEMMEEIKRVLRPRGHIILREHDASDKRNIPYYNFFHMVYAVLLRYEETPEDHIAGFPPRYRSADEWVSCFDWIPLKRKHGPMFEGQEVKDKFDSVYLHFGK